MQNVQELCILVLTSDSGKKMFLTLNKVPTVCGFIKDDNVEKSTARKVNQR